MHIIPVASGKGGVGKSMVAANLAIALAQAGKDVVLADIDLGASNLHLIIGLATPRCGIGTWLSRSGAAFEDIIYQTDYPNMRFIPGDAELPGLANLTARQKNLLSKKLLELKADYLILDLGAGTSSNILDFFLLSGRGMVVTAPTLTATLNAYLFLKNIIFRLMWESFKPKTKARNILEGLRRDGSSLQRVYIPDIVARIALEDPESHAIFDQRMQRFNPRLIMNMLEDPKDADKAQKIRRSCREYLGIDLEHLGIIYRDDMQDVALGSRIPIIRYKPHSLIAQAIYRIADKLIATESDADDDYRLSDEEYLDDSFSAAGTEAETDFDAKVGYVEELLSSGALTPGDLIETIRMQQFELTQVRKENQFLKHKLTHAIAQGFNV
ncbi:MAG: ATP-binding protein [Spirochaetes bacterium GWD1_61_31]|nr:MAG: ATP-binding protein [Spirochaetes bacterium GWB1_60_80]OHD35351.1 MAG: ATP-binding protein [Spirochaetes bacterium GWC1_61_12]OHD36120.1 MAG: ATP-binding protein [Spirochaetes bacterium GWD1_61_31]OHD45007.1 MAG: ATP-binding protein [Spirochaetes bacterium GWE1_60_18]OHD60117.1 MAG: ATP-binding protein [Spirochaetes bacterium GWF1_60_12]HAP43686.1 ATP-binding protein [Spirochaetaceae bacterium]